MIANEIRKGRVKQLIVYLPWSDEAELWKLKAVTPDGSIVLDPVETSSRNIDTDDN